MPELESSLPWGAVHVVNDPFGSPRQQFVHVLVDGVPVARLPVVAVTTRMDAEGLGHVDLSLPVMTAEAVGGVRAHRRHS